MVEGDVNLISDSVISNLLNNAKFGCFKLLKNRILGLELAKKNAIGELITWLDDNWSVDLPPRELNRAPPIVHGTQFILVHPDMCVPHW